MLPIKKQFQGSKVITLYPGMTPTIKKVLAYGVHLFTASGTLFGLAAIFLIDKADYQLAFVAMFAAIIIDAVDGTLARLFDVKNVIKGIDGATLDNIVDFFNYSMVPCFFLMRTDLIAEPYKFVCIASIALASCYQFAQTDAKTEDHFFKGFPSYWNIVVFYEYYWQLSSAVSVAAILFLSFLSFVPIKFVYPSRLEHASKSKLIRILIFVATVVWGIDTIALIATYPKPVPILNGLSIAYVVFYAGFSVDRTYSPLKLKKSLQKGLAHIQSRRKK
ncbi:MAG: hypothetical protein KA436_12780, partial [Oligoflexales bacterium]|nr:hypothetical protein [Oligoflexales bacterium]